ncbi:hypothetical protein HDV00_010172 [Rhizophlyctis rosea]|nr:hypothetical protein HDV00_010172 [Rhizophlyctis rosea]
MESSATPPHSTPSNQDPSLVALTVPAHMPLHHGGSPLGLPGAEDDSFQSMDLDDASAVSDGGSDAGGGGGGGGSGMAIAHGVMPADSESSESVDGGDTVVLEDASSEESLPLAGPSTNNTLILHSPTPTPHTTLLLPPATTPTPPPIPPPTSFSLSTSITLSTLTSTALAIRPRYKQLPPELLSHVLRFAYMNSRRQFLNNALVARHWAESALPILWERIAPRSNFPLAVVLRALDRIHRTLTSSQQLFSYASFPRAVSIQLHLRNNAETLETSHMRRLTDEFIRVVEVIPPLLTHLTKLRDLGITFRIEEISAPLQASATTFLERFLFTVPRPERALWFKLAGIAVLDAQCKSLADRFGRVLTDFHLTKCVGCSERGLRYLLERCEGVGSLALYVPTVQGSLLGTISRSNRRLQDLWLDLPMEEGGGGGFAAWGGGGGAVTGEGVDTFCNDLRLLLRSSPRLRRLRLRGVPLTSEKADEMLRIIGEEGRGITSLSVLVWPPESMGSGVRDVKFTRLTKLIVSSNSRLSNEFLMSVSRCCPVLSVVDAGRTRIDDAVVESLVRNCRIEVLDVSRCAGVTGRSLWSIAEFATRIRSLDVSFCGRVVGGPGGGAGAGGVGGGGGGGGGADLRFFVWLAVRRGRGLERFGCDFWEDGEGGGGGGGGGGGQIGGPGGGGGVGGVGAVGGAVGAGPAVFTFGAPAAQHNTEPWSKTLFARFGSYGPDSTTSSSSSLSTHHLIHGSKKHLSLKAIKADFEDWWVRQERGGGRGMGDEGVGRGPGDERWERRVREWGERVRGLGRDGGWGGGGGAGSGGW